MKAADPASLQNLNDIVLPADVGWWPLAAGWYVVFTFLVLVFVFVSYRMLKRWFVNRYRRAAVRELQLLAQAIRNDSNRAGNLRQIPLLLKRTALSAYPRAQVAALAGEGWHDFLDLKLGKPLFSETAGGVLDRVAYSTGELDEISGEQADILLDASRQWLRFHRVSTGANGNIGT
jgi:hypothetical protein